VLISMSFCTFSSVTFTISPLTIHNTSVLISMSFVFRKKYISIQKC
jgi:hypothetical protein